LKRDFFCGWPCVSFDDDALAAAETVAINWKIDRDFPRGDLHWRSPADEVDRAAAEAEEDVAGAPPATFPGIETDAELLTAAVDQADLKVRSDVKLNEVHFSLLLKRGLSSPYANTPWKRRKVHSYFQEK
jgi:hypothetical protein